MLQPGYARSVLQGEVKDLQVFPTIYDLCAHTHFMSHLLELPMRQTGSDAVCNESFCDSLSAVPGHQRALELGTVYGDWESASEQNSWDKYVTGGDNNTG